MSLFEKAAQMKLRFTTSKGSIAVEDLFDLPLTGVVSLDNIAKALDEKLSKNNKSFVNTVIKATDEVTQLAFDIVKHVIKLKLEERDAMKHAAANAQKRQKIMAIIEGKESDALEGNSLKDLRKMLEELV